MRECVDCSRPLNDGAIECDWCAMRAEIRRLNIELSELRDRVADRSPVDAAVLVALPLRTEETQ